MKFEKPAIKISKFNRENVFTLSGIENTKPTLAESLSEKTGQVDAVQTANWQIML